MNYMPQVLKMLGVEVDEIFDVVHPDFGVIFDTDYQFSLDENDDLILKNKYCSHNNVIFIEILKGARLIQKRPWKPKLGERYYLVKHNGGVTSECFNGYDYEYYFFNSGNMFKTREEVTPEMVEQVIKEMKGPYDANKPKPGPLDI